MIKNHYERQIVMGGGGGSWMRNVHGHRVFVGGGRQIFMNGE